MSDQVSHTLLQVLPLATRLTEQDLKDLGRDYPDFDIPKLLEGITMGGEPAVAAAPVAPIAPAAPAPAPAAPAPAAPRVARMAPGAPSPTLQQKSLQLELELQKRALARLVPECDRAWRNIAGQLKRASRIELAGSLIGLFGSGGTAAGILANLRVPVIVAAIACVGSILTLVTKFQRGSFSEGGLPKDFKVFADARGQLIQLQDEVAVWLTQPREMLLANHDRILATARRAQELGLIVDAALGNAGPE